MKLAIVRTSGDVVSDKFYNLQELGLAKSLLPHNINTDIYMAGRGKKVEVNMVAENNHYKVRIIRLPFLLIPFIDQALYPKLFKYLENHRYDVIQTAEENEITSFLLSVYGRIRNIPVIVNQGMYMQITGRIRAFYQKIYDRLLLPILIKNVALASVKTTSAKKHLEKKGFKKYI